MREWEGGEGGWGNPCLFRREHKLRPSLCTHVHHMDYIEIYVHVPDEKKPHEIICFAIPKDKM